MLAPKGAEVMLVSDREHCERIRDCLIQNKMVDYQFYPPVSWLDYYRMTIDDYQRHIPDPQLRRDQPLRHVEISSSDDESEERQLLESEEILFTDTKEAPVT